MPQSKTATVTILLVAMLLANVLLFGIVKCQNNSENQVSGVIINEFMADNGITVSGPDGNSPDWIELYNSGTETVDLAGMYLTDDLLDPTCWQFPDDSTIEAGEYMIIWANTNGGEGYATFSLNANGEAIGLFASDGVTLIDSVVYTKQLQDVSYGRDPRRQFSLGLFANCNPPVPANREAVGTETSVWSLLVIVAFFAIVTVVVVVIGRLNKQRK